MKRIILILFLGVSVNLYSQVNPFYPKGKIIKHSYYTVNYCEKCNAANYSYYILTKQEMAKRTLKRGFRFKKDPAEPQILPSVYNKKYDRGHLCPFESMAFDSTAAKECFYMTNVIPQNPNFNRGLWKKAEELEREIAANTDSTWIISGCIYTTNTTFTIDNIYVPDFMYKIISTRTQTIAYIFPNITLPGTDIEKYKTTLENITKLSGVVFR